MNSILTAMGRRINREKKTVAAMIRIFCGNVHNCDLAGCPECSSLKDYIFERLERCRYGEEKPVCKNCRTHCFKPENRGKIREIMRFSGPRMIFCHPLLTVLHIMYSRK